MAFDYVAEARHHALTAKLEDILRELRAITGLLSRVLGPPA